MLKKPIELNLYDDEGKTVKTFKLCVIPWGMMKKATALGNKLSKIEDDDEAVFDGMASYVCEVYKNQFTVDDVNDHMEYSEVVQAIQEVQNALGINVPNVKAGTPQKATPENMTPNGGVVANS